MIALIVTSFSCKQEIDLIQDDAKGSNMLLIGNSFFKPYAEKLDVMAVDAGFGNHRSTIVKRGGENGRPINFWNDSTSAEHLLIKETLDQGGIEFFGMTSGHDPEHPIEGHRAWIEYALQNNPDVTIFIAIPPIDYPLNWDSLAQYYGYNTIEEVYEYFVGEVVHQKIVDSLRAEFPSNNIFTIPTGWATFKLAQMQEDDELLDEIDLFGPKPESIFTDEKGHQGQIVIETGGLVWLSSLYGVDLGTNTYETGFKTDLHVIAEEIVLTHDVDYQQY